MIKQSAGMIAVEAYTDGHPITANLHLQRGGSEAHLRGLGVNDLHDLRYCVDRVLAQLLHERCT